MEQLIYPVAVWAICGLLGYAVGRMKQSHKDSDTRMDALCDGMRSLLRNELVKEHRSMIEKGGCTLLDKEIAERNYRPYHALGGNGIGTAMYQEIKESKTLTD